MKPKGGVSSGLIAAGHPPPSEKSNVCPGRFRGCRPGVLWLGGIFFIMRANGFVRKALLAYRELYNLGNFASLLPIRLPV